MFLPKNICFNKMHKIIPLGIHKKNKKNLTFGKFGLKSLECGTISHKLLKNIQLTLIQTLKPYKGKYWIRFHTYNSKTSKSIGVRMGKGKGVVTQWISVIKKGKILIEINLPIYSFSVATYVLKKIQTKLSFKTKVLLNDFD